MNVYLQEWANGTASLVNEFGQVLSVFENLEEAKSICKIWQVETAGTVSHKQTAKPAVSKSTRLSKSSSNS